MKPNNHETALPGIGPRTYITPPTPKPRRPPWRLALYALAIACAAGAGVGIAIGIAWKFARIIIAL